MKRLRVSNMKKTNTGTHLMLSFTGEFGLGNVRGVIFKASSKSKLVLSLEENRDNLLDIVGSISGHSQYGSNIIIEDIRTSDHV
jgi:hypothetical protein